MPADKTRSIYIASLLILGALLVLFAQGAFSGLYGGTGEPAVEISRVDLYNEFVGNYSKVSVMVFNNDTVSHNFSINTFFDERPAGSYNISVNSGKTFKYQKDVLYESDFYASGNGSGTSGLNVAKFVVYLDNQSTPFEEASFVYNKE